MPLAMRTNKKKLATAFSLAAVIACSFCNAPAAFFSFLSKPAHNQRVPPMRDKWVTIHVKAGDSLTKLLQRKKLATSDISYLDKRAHKLLSRLKPGESIEIIPQNGHIAWLRYYPTEANLLLVERKKNKLVSSLTKVPFTYNLNFKSVRIHNNLSSGEYAAKFSTTMITDIKRMFAGSIDLNRALHRGDTLDILYEEYYLKGTLHHTGHVVAATLQAKHRNYTAFQYKIPHGPTGFYKANGHSVNPLFLAFPLKFKRVSSPFNLHRLDPVTHRIAPHIGVDLAAKIGTPIRSIGNGKVVYKGWVRGYGNTVEINYGQHRQSLYGHLSKYALHLRRGQHVRKGEVVGFVGQTGWATGPHLHFGFYLKGKPVDWLKYKKPVTAPIPRTRMASFRNYTHELQSQLLLYHDVQLAKNSLKVGDSKPAKS